jgi:hypothetical protein
MAKPFHLMTAAEKTAFRIAQNREISERNVETLTLSGPSYQTAQLYEYDPTLQKQASKLFQWVQECIGKTKATKYDGSYSIFHSRGSYTAAKIIIYERSLGRMCGDWPSLIDGVYVLIRANGRVGDKIWGDIPEIADHTRTLGIAPNHSERFAYFMPSIEDNSRRVADIIMKCTSTGQE